MSKKQFKNNAFANSPLVQVSTAWKEEQAKIQRAKSRNERALFVAAVSQESMTLPVLKLKKMRQEKFQRLSAEMFPEVEGENPIFKRLFSK